MAKRGSNIYKRKGFKDLKGVCLWDITMIAEKLSISPCMQERFQKSRKRWHSFYSVRQEQTVSS